MSSKRALVVLSGGQDSTTCLFWAVERYETVHAVTFDYGQRHRSEILAARRVAALAGVASHEVVELGPILAGTSPLTNPAEQLAQYADAQSLPGGLEKTFVPGRNILFMTLAANRAYCLEADDIITGICQEDFGGYPDCREAFRIRMERALHAGLDRYISIQAPLMFLTKRETVQLAKKNLHGWHALAFSHTAYDGNYPPTGKDHASLLREKGFQEAGLPDPLVVRAWLEGLMPLPQTPNYENIMHRQTYVTGNARPADEVLHSVFDTRKLAEMYSLLAEKNLG